MSVAAPHTAMSSPGRPGCIVKSCPSESVGVRQDYSGGGLEEGHQPGPDLRRGSALAVPVLLQGVRGHPDRLPDHRQIRLGIAMMPSPDERPDARSENEAHWRTYDDTKTDCLAYRTIDLRTLGCTVYTQGRDGCRRHDDGPDKAPHSPCTAPLPYLFDLRQGDPGSSPQVHRCGVKLKQATLEPCVAGRLNPPHRAGMSTCEEGAQACVGARFLRVDS
jgi:hypothetical protein